MSGIRMVWGEYILEQHPYFVFFLHVSNVEIPNAKRNAEIRFEVHALQTTIGEKEPPVGRVFSRV